LEAPFLSVSLLAGDFVPQEVTEPAIAFFVALTSIMLCKLAKPSQPPTELRVFITQPVVAET
jgi:hypothetical protein